MYAPAKRAVRDISRARAYANRRLRQPTPRPFHSSTSFQDDGKSNDGSKEKNEDAGPKGATRVVVIERVDKCRMLALKTIEALKLCPSLPMRTQLVERVRSRCRTMEALTKELSKASWTPTTLSKVLQQVAELSRRLETDQSMLDGEAARMFKAAASRLKGIEEELDLLEGGVPVERKDNIDETQSPSKRKQRTRQRASEAPQLPLPDWFHDRNILLHQPLDSHPELVPTTRNTTTKEALLKWSGSIETNEGSIKVGRNYAGPFNASPSTNKDFSGQVDFYVDFEPYAEICAGIAASFALSSGRQSAPTQNVNLVLYCAIDGATQLLKSVVRSVAKDLKADILRLHMHDLAALSGVHSVLQSSSDVQQLGTIGLVANQEPAKMEDKQPDEDDNEESEHSERDTIIPLEQLKDYLLQMESIEPARPSSRRADDRNGRAVSLTRFLDRLIKAAYVQRDKSTMVMTSNNSIELNPAQSKKSSSDLEQSESVIQTPDTKSDGSVATESRSTKSRLIICLEDFRGLSATPIGAKVIQTLGNLVEYKREKYGDSITIVGITSSSQLTPKSEIQQPYSSRYRTMLVHPLEGDLAALSAQNSKPQDIQSSPPTTIWDLATGHETQTTNLRNIHEMLRRLLPAGPSLSYIEDRPIFPEKLAERLGLQSRLLSAEEVHRIAMAAVGLQDISSGELSVKDVQHAMLLCHGSDVARASALIESPKSSKAKASNTGDIHQRMQQLKPNKYEKELLAGVIFPEKIRTGFADVHAAADTIEALKTMTSLSMARPDAFQYGILKSDSLSGLLMYGPPGTGKTMLARAVAKDSGAAVLNITASDVRHMWVGEAEKIVKAIFSLSQKLSPCIVFIDEADSLLGARSQKDHSRNHRDTINQFLLEWDGLTERDVFLMIATNRPFDLDDAVLRRLPRRLLVDLPKREDRQAILGIHLREEVLDESVSLADLAEKTPFYSGSDLKNVVVSAALACVKEENEVAAKAKADGITDHQYPTRRTLTNEHFEKALQEVSASVSGSMPSLKAIRKFDEQYGDKKGKQKTKTSMGFVQEKPKERSARVRA
jgi:SpoVK/Ycf46/Vps4 family AAA+-type ATPase